MYGEWFDQSAPQPASQITGNRRVFAPRGGQGSPVPPHAESHSNFAGSEWAPAPRSGFEEAGRGALRDSSGLGAPREEESGAAAGRGSQQRRDSQEPGLRGAAQAEALPARAEGQSSTERAGEDFSVRLQRGSSGGSADRLAAAMDASPGDSQAVQRERDAFWRESGSNNGNGLAPGGEQSGVSQQPFERQSA